MDVITMFPNSFLIDMRLRSDVPALAFRSTRHSMDLVDLYTEALNPACGQVASSSNHLAIYLGDRLHSDPDYLQKKCSTGWDACEDNGLFVHVDGVRSMATIFSDFLGTEIAYYQSFDDRILISNRIENFRLIAESRADIVSMLQFLRAAYTVGDRTLIAGVKKTRPLSTVQIDTRNGKVSDLGPRNWSDNGSRKPSRDEITDLWREVLCRAPESVLMLSGGWDSRLLLAANSERINASYTHGDLESRELKIALMVGGRRVPEIIFRSLEETCYGADSLTERLTQLGHAFFPHWYNAARFLARRHAKPITAGLFVGHFSGHEGINSAGKGASRVASTIKSMLFSGAYDRLSSQQAVAMASKLLHWPLRAPWYLSQEWLSEHEHLENVNKEHIEEVLDKFYKEETGGVQEIFERFRLEHSGRQYFALQTKCGIPFNGYHHPYADSQLATTIFRTPYKDRVNYQLSRAVLKGLAPDLLAFPMAATLVPARYPVILQEISRGTRIIMERALAIRDKERKLHLGWNNFEFLYETEVFEEYVDMLKGSMWPKEQMWKSLEAMRANGTPAFSVLDMFGKILTVDHVVFGRN